MSGSRALLVFAKTPKPGKVKTRLLTAVSAEVAATLHEGCIADTLRLVREIGGGGGVVFAGGGGRVFLEGGEGGGRGGKIGVQAPGSKGNGGRGGEGVVEGFLGGCCW